MSEAKRNTRGGAGYKARKTGKQKIERKIEELDVEAGEGYYGTVMRLLGGNRIEAKLHTGGIVQARIPGIMYKKRGNWMKVGAIIQLDGADDFYEVIRIVKDANNDAEQAKEIISKSNNNNDIFGDGKSEDDNDDELDKLINPNIVLKKQGVSAEKTMLTLKRKEDQKSRTIASAKGQGRQFSDVKDLREDS